MEKICHEMQAPSGENIMECIQLIKRYFKPVSYDEAIEMIKSDPIGYLSVCYFNKTCHDVAYSVLGGTKAVKGVRLVNRKREPGLYSGILMVNYEYLVNRVNRKSGTVDLQCVDEGTIITTTKNHVSENMHWSYTRTCHSLQGTSVEGNIILHDLWSNFMTKEYLYTAITRARRIDSVYYVEDGPRCKEEHTV